jgi:hypothetical protein
MVDSKICQFCGGEIRFRMIDGICVPLHDESQGCATSARSGHPDTCHQTSCPYCGGKVYFVRHNNGTVWFNDLGQPWDKHGCFLTQSEPTSPLEDAIFNLRRIKNILRYYKLENGEKAKQPQCFQIHFGVTGKHASIWYVLPEIASEEVLRWKGRYCYVSNKLGELQFFNGEKHVMFMKDEI